MNLKVRLKNPWFWVGLLGVILTAVGLEPEMFTSWSAVWQSLLTVVSNPYKLGCVAVAILGIFVDPTTAGLSDSERAKHYSKPYREVE